ncbi:hypothetical protein [Steroidobacter agaridevorans]|uniref:hypothetical protein n=1 Tax=Steroidobacter agaridevorans TaxID=2695856 RepID=UPI00137A9059|nr:hypothetical protein [Steroidobacter agaridevorans]
MDDDDLPRAQEHANTARTVPDSDEIDVIVKELFIRRLNEYLGGIDRSIIDEINAALDPELPLEERQRLLFELIRKRQLEIVPFKPEPSDDNNPENRRKILDAIRARQIDVALELQKQWSDPPKNKLIGELDRRGGDFQP